MQCCQAAQLVEDLRLVHRPVGHRVMSQHFACWLKFGADSCMETPFPLIIITFEELSALSMIPSSVDH